METFKVNVLSDAENFDHVITLTFIETHWVASSDRTHIHRRNVYNWAHFASISLFAVCQTSIDGMVIIRSPCIPHVREFTFRNDQRHTQRINAEKNQTCVRCFPALCVLNIRPEEIRGLPEIYDNSSTDEHLGPGGPYVLHMESSSSSSSNKHSIALVSSLPFQPDHLDFHLHALYDNHRDWWKSNAEALVQVETEKHLCCARSHRTTIRKNASIQPRRLLTSWTSSCREHLSHVTEAIDGHHLQATNGGYSRKPNESMISGYNLHNFKYGSSIYPWANCGSQSSENLAEIVTMVTLRDMTNEEKYTTVVRPVGASSANKPTTVYTIQLSELPTFSTWPSAAGHWILSKWTVYESNGIMWSEVTFRLQKRYALLRFAQFAVPQRLPSHNLARFTDHEYASFFLLSESAFVYNCVIVDECPRKFKKTHKSQSKVIIGTVSVQTGIIPISIEFLVFFEFQVSTGPVKLSEHVQKGITGRIWSNRIIRKKVVIRRDQSNPVLRESSMRVRSNF
ncbi:hypothetical protein CLF_103197 [Clonorchis sinensis]|uniref:Uncharacterized protein n=1 Tax=Clonorchis sinensis TaxID=79923 RepID=G7Y9B2_CLOSI|nr:hypothetical protein CLF_103197 [Clonorchis sinensis]